MTRARDPAGGLDDTVNTGALHFIGFRGDEYGRAVRIFGPPDFIHFGWDRWARMEVMPDDTAIFAKGEYDDEPSPFGYPDLYE